MNIQQDVFYLMALNIKGILLNVLRRKITKEYFS